MGMGPERKAFFLQRDSEIIALYPSATMEAIAEMYDISTQRVHQVINLNNVPTIRRRIGKDHQKYKNIDIDLVKQLRSQGKTLADISEQLKTSISLLSKRLKEAGESASANPVPKKARKASKKGFKLTRKQVSNIWLELNDPDRVRTIGEIAKKYKITAGMIAHIRLGYAWNHVTGVPKPVVNTNPNKNWRLERKYKRLESGKNIYV